MHPLLKIFLIFAKIGAVSFGGGYAMLPFIKKEVIDVHGYLTHKQFLDVLAISQITPGPIAINSATFIGYLYHGFFGSLFATLGIVFGPTIYMTVVNSFLDRFKESKVVLSILYYLRPVTSALIFSAFLSTFVTSMAGTIDFIFFILAFVLIYTGKISPMTSIFIFGFVGIVMEFII